MHDKFEKKMLKTREREDVYIIKKIVKDLNKFILFLILLFISYIDVLLIRISLCELTIRLFK